MDSHLPIAINTPLSLEPFFTSLGFVRDSTLDVRSDDIRMIHEGIQRPPESDTVVEKDFPEIPAACGNEYSYATTTETRGRTNSY